MSGDSAREGGVSRRTVLAAGLAAPAAGAVLSRAGSDATAGPRVAHRVFAHGVASGDPTGTAVLLWTRVTPEPAATPGSGRGGAVVVGWEVSSDRAFRRVVRRGTVRTGADRDHTVKVDVQGLPAYTRFFYRFRALGVTSPVGRTQTSGDEGVAGRVHALRLGLVSCSNWTGGFFSAYRHLARRDDLDLVLHLGDYFYEYGNDGDRYGPAELVGVRDHVPAVEPVTLAQYRARHGHYKTDPDLQAAHAAHPWVVIFDDHEVTNDTHSTGAENHQDGEGSFALRRQAAYRAYLEWMPVRLPDQRVPHEGLRFWRRFDFGPLADLSVVETRQNRSQPVPGAAGGLVGTDPAISDASRVLMEPEQMAWLTAGLRSPGRRWHLMGNQTVFARVAAPHELPGREALAAAGLPGSGPVFNTDQWDGYADDQAEVLRAMADGAAAGADTVVLTGDIHSSWANDIPRDAGTYLPVGPANNSVATEVVCPSVTSDGFAEILGGTEAAALATTGLQAMNPHIRFLDGVGHGFTVLDVTPEAVQADWFFVSDRTDPAASLSHAASWRTVHGTQQMVEVDGPVGPRSDRPRTP